MYRAPAEQVRPKKHRHRRGKRQNKIERVPTGARSASSKKGDERLLVGAGVAAGAFAGGTGSAAAGSGFLLLFAGFADQGFP